MNTSAEPHDPRPIGAIANDVLHKTETLIRQELQLGLADAESRLVVMRAELGNELRQLKLELSAKVIGGAVVFAGALTLTAAAVWLLAQAFEHQKWLAALIVGVVLGASGVALWLRKVSAPEQATALIREHTFEATQHDVKSMEKAIK
jgi:hypothetical protein